MSKPLTVGDLVHSLRDVPRNAVVMLASDAEGNEIHVLDGIDYDVPFDLGMREPAFDEGDAPGIVLFPEHG